MRPVLFLIALWSALRFDVGALAAPSRSANSAPRVLVEKKDHLPRAWQYDSVPSAHAEIVLSMGLRQSNLHRLDEELLSVSDPRSPS